MEAVHSQPRWSIYLDSCSHQVPVKTSHAPRLAGHCRALFNRMGAAAFHSKLLPGNLVPERSCLRAGDTNRKRAKYQDNFTDPQRTNADLTQETSGRRISRSRLWIVLGVVQRQAEGLRALDKNFLFAI